MPVKVNQERRAFLGWDVLVKSAIARHTITYGSFAHAMSIHPRATKYVLDILYEYCELQELPRLTMLVVTKSTQKPGIGFTDYSEETFQDDLEQVYDFKWGEIVNPFEFADLGYETESLIEELIDNPDSSEMLYARIKSRGSVQALFRQMLLRVYDYQCAICGFTFEESLDASHIIGFWDCTINQRLDVRNGILLCSNHHKLFDAGYFMIDENYIIHYLDYYDAVVYNKSDTFFTRGFDKKRLNLPKVEKNFPGKEFLKKRNSSL